MKEIKATWQEAEIIRKWYQSNYGKRTMNNPKRGINWAGVLKSYGYPEYIAAEDQDVAPMTAADADRRVKAWSGWVRPANVLARLELEREAAEYAELEEEFGNPLLEDEMEDEPTSTVPKFPWPEVPLEQTLVDYGLSTTEVVQALFRVGPDDSSKSYDARGALALKVWERAHKPGWAKHDPDAYRDEQETLKRVLAGKADVPQAWIDEGIRSLKQWQTYNEMGMGGVKSMYVAWDDTGIKHYFETVADRNAWMKLNPGSYN